MRWIGSMGSLRTSRQPGLMGPWTTEGFLTLNPVLFDHAVDEEVARVVSRLLCGGQGLRGGDPRISAAPSRRTACLFCLLQGRREKETLIISSTTAHFTMPCASSQESCNSGRIWLIRYPAFTVTFGDSRTYG
ncbi:unnamed protein product [Polarella glacialis]|uniref:Uncharacterized protein n=1 Tax=Polarella glacialis TaxID=89957 RepID=A0A813HR13_POLGL|nr:unnamed protein product [Polarella glacialis]